MQSLLKVHSPNSRLCVKQVTLPVKNPTCVTFGGQHLDKLYVTSMKEEGANASQNWGGVFVVHIEGEFGLAPAYKTKIPAS